MVEQYYEVRWNNTARNQVRKIYDYIAKDSVQNAKSIIEKILSSTEKLEKNPERFGLDKYKKDNDGSYRHHEPHKHRTVFRIYKSHTRTPRVRSTNQEPLLY